MIWREERRAEIALVAQETRKVPATGEQASGSWRKRELAARGLLAMTALAARQPRQEQGEGVVE
jgi:hypothetical protein